MLDLSLTPLIVTSLLPSDDVNSNALAKAPIYLAFASIINLWEYMALNIVEGDMTPDIVYPSLTSLYFSPSSDAPTKNISLSLSLSVVSSPLFSARNSIP